MRREELLKVGKPILFNTDMVRAILAGRKTATRRIVDIDISNCFDVERDGTVIAYINPESGDSYEPTEIFRYQTGDILYVRETWGEGYEEGSYIYKADDKLANLPEFKESSKLIYHPSIHMPKEAARIFLKVTNVRVERLQDIDNRGCYAEGIEVSSLEPYFYDLYKARFKTLWNSTIKKSNLDRYGWDANPWVWVIEFERVVEE